MIIPLHVACNDPGNGNFAEVAPMIEVLDLRLEARNWWDRPPRFVEVGYDAVRLAGKVWQICDSRHWVGNWCWNTYQLWHRQKAPGWVVADFLIWLRGRRLYSAEEGPSDLFDWFNGDRDASPADVHGWLAESWKAEQR